MQCSSVTFGFNTFNPASHPDLDFGGRSRKFDRLWYVRDQPSPGGCREYRNSYQGYLKYQRNIIKKRMTSDALGRIDSLIYMRFPTIWMPSF